MGQFFGAGPPEDPSSWVTTNSECPNAKANACAHNGCPRGVPTGEHSIPQRCVARGQLRVAALVFAIFFLLTYAVLGYIRYLREIGFLPQYPLFGLPLYDIPPAFAICAALAVLAMGYAAIAYLPRSWQIPVVLLLAAWLGFANNDPFNNRFENMNYNKDHLVALRGRVVNAYDQDPKARIEEADSQKIDPLHLRSDIAALDAWKAGAAKGDPDVEGGRPKLVLVAVSGGATRSAYWTAVVLDRLERTLGPSFGGRVRIISGASGGNARGSLLRHLSAGCGRRKLGRASGSPRAWSGPRARLAAADVDPQGPADAKHGPAGSGNRTHGDLDGRLAGHRPRGPGSDTGEGLECPPLSLH